MDIFVKTFGSAEPPIKFSDIDDEETILDFKQRVADQLELDVE